MLKSGSSNKRGAVLSIDTAVAVTLAIIVMASATFFASNLDEEPLTKVNMVRQMRDITAILDYDGVLATLDNTSIAGNMTAYLDARFSSQIEIFVNNLTSNSIQYLSAGPSHNLTTNTTLITEKRITVIGNQIAEVRYWVWAK